MKLLFDENVSPRLIGLLEDEYPGSTHVRDAGLLGAPDRRIWDHARENAFAIVSKDDDFRQRSFLHGAPPKVVWLQVGNAGTAAIAELLRAEASRLRRFENEAESALLILSLARRAVQRIGAQLRATAPPWLARSAHVSMPDTTRGRLEPAVARQLQRLGQRASPYEYSESQRLAVSSRSSR